MAHQPTRNSNGAHRLNLYNNEATRPTRVSQTSILYHNSWLFRGQFQLPSGRPVPPVQRRSGQGVGPSNVRSIFSTPADSTRPFLFSQEPRLAPQTPRQSAAPVPRIPPELIRPLRATSLGSPVLGAARPRHRGTQRQSTRGRQRRGAMDLGVVQPGGRRGAIDLGVIQPDGRRGAIDLGRPDGALISRVEGRVRRLGQPLTNFSGRQNPVRRQTTVNTSDVWTGRSSRARVSDAGDPFYTGYGGRGNGLFGRLGGRHGIALAYRWRQYLGQGRAQRQPQADQVYEQVGPSSSDIRAVQAFMNMTWQAENSHDSHRGQEEQEAVAVEQPAAAFFEGLARDFNANIHSENQKTEAQRHGWR